MIKKNEILSFLAETFPDAKCELNYSNLYELLVSVMLSAQTTDRNVNENTPQLFKEYKDYEALSKASLERVKELIHHIGLYNTKAKNLILMAQKVTNEFGGNIPPERDILMTLPGVGRKTANVYLAEGYKEPYFPVDTHVNRVSKRLRLVSKEATLLEVEETLMKKFKKEDWYKLHLELIFFGRYMCHAIKPECEKCLFVNRCNK